MWQTKNLMSKTESGIAGWLRRFVRRTAPKTQKPKIPKTPSKGEKWRIDDGDPFPPKCTVEILDIADGWVRYKIGSGTMFDDERKSMSSFINCYRFHSAPNEKS